ncbi:HEF3 [Symbiodinium sp. CCMP2456]|nr:HEF3 [Symbiodinium sp. CCMP2456]
MGKKPGKKEEKQTRRCAVISLALSWKQHAARSQWEGKHPEPKSRVDERKVLATVKLLGPMICWSDWRFPDIPHTVDVATIFHPAGEILPVLNRVFHTLYKVCNLLEFKLDCSPSTKISFIVDRIVDRHGSLASLEHVSIIADILVEQSCYFNTAGGSISDLSVCVNRFHPEEVVGRVRYRVFWLRRHENDSSQTMS